MKAVQVTKVGGPEVLVLREVPNPVPGKREVFIRIAASGVNFVDIYVRAGHYGSPLPFIPGQEAAGTIAAVGEDVTEVKVGDRVVWCAILGTYAEYAIAPADRVVAIPENLDFKQAAAAMLQGMTAHYLAHSTYPIKKGDAVLIHAGAGGVGLLLTQIAKSLGARVFTTVSTEFKAELSRGAGADEVILYTEKDFAEEVRRLTSGQGVEVVYDSVGKTTFEQSLKSLRRRGTLVVYGSSSGAVPPFDLMQLVAFGSLYVTRPSLRDHSVTRSELVTRATEIMSAIANGSLNLRIERTYPLADAAQAHQDLEGRKTTGKLLLVP
jgi:NADPH2:quinone reductase